MNIAYFLFSKFVSWIVFSLLSSFWIWNLSMLRCLLVTVIRSWRNNFSHNVGTGNNGYIQIILPVACMSLPVAGLFNSFPVSFPGLPKLWWLLRWKLHYIILFTKWFVIILMVNFVYQKKMILNLLPQIQYSVIKCQIVISAKFQFRSPIIRIS